MNEIQPCSLTAELKELLLAKGADLVGIGSLKDIADCAWPVGVSIAIALPPHIIGDLQNAPTREYYDLYHAINAKLNAIVLAGEGLLKARGYGAYAQTTDRVKTNQDKISPLPHKTVATRAALGWIGKNCLLITSQYGAAVRLSSLLTNAPLKCDEPILSSRCASCEACAKACPAAALHGALWSAGMSRDKLLDFRKCYDKQIEIMTANVGIAVDLCGKCFAVCPYARKYQAGARSSGQQ